MYLFRKVALSIVILSCSMSAHAVSFASVVAFIQSLTGTNSALSITTKQTALSANVISTAGVSTGQQFATAAGGIALSNKIVDAMIATDYKLGQPNTSKCVAQQQAGIHVEAESQRDKDAGHLMTTFSSSRISSQVYANQQMLSAHRDLYCTASEAKQGMCELSPNGMQGWDSNYAGAFNEATLAPEAEIAAYAYVTMVSDNRAPAKIDCTDAMCNAAQASQMGLAAISGMAANSLIGQVVDRRQPIITGK